ncbi:MAG: hypothetical protein JWR83_920, partial [Aeromicrobium sp.]|nr:hypothetical protein [Aeromicrobium sp.]
AGLACLLGRFVLELAVVHEAAHGWTGCGSNLNEIEIGFCCQSQGILNADDAYLFTARTDEANFWNADSVVDA